MKTIRRRTACTFHKGSFVAMTTNGGYLYYFVNPDNGNMPGMPSTEIGTCGLCGAAESHLCNSDLIPKAISRWVRKAMEGEPNPNPVLISKRRAVQKNYRLAEYFLCPTCEETLNKHGETWVLKNAYRGQNHFPMRSALDQAKLLHRWNGADVIDVSALLEFQLPQVIHFASGIFWKATARKWNSPDDCIQLDLGPYAERFRRYLIGYDPFPETAALVVNISGNSKPLMCSIYPYYSGRIQGTRQYRMALPGLAFWLHLGHLTDEMKALCAVRNRVVFLVPNLDEVFLREGGKLISLVTSRKLR